MLNNEKSDPCENCFYEEGSKYCIEYCPYEASSAQEPVANEMNKIVMQSIEEEDKFIFTTIKPYCEKIAKREISKKDLEKALLQYFGKDSCDAISRKDAVRCVLSSMFLSEASEKIERLPGVSMNSADGHWVIQPDFKYGNYVQCLHCQAYICTLDYHGKYVYDSYCPNCGRKMDSIKELVDALGSENI